MKLENRSILITGGTSGIGHQLVRLLVERNQLVVLGRDADNLARVKDEFSSVSTYRCCLADASQLDETIALIRRHHPTLSVLINNAAIQHTPTLLEPEFCYDSIEREIAINLAAPVKLCSLLLNDFLHVADGSAFINIGSGLALSPKTSSAVYCATKAGLHSLSRSLRYQLEGTPIKVFEAILPLVDTTMTTGRGRDKLSAAQAAKTIIAGVEAGREEHYIGKARILPLLARFCPNTMAKMMKRA